MTTSSRRILVASDLSDPSAEAVKQAHAHALSVEGRLGVCHVLPSPGVHMLFPQQYANEAAQEAALDERVRAIVSEKVIATTARAPTSFEVFVEHGTPYAEVVRRAEAWHATLVVVGGHGRTGAGALLGGVAEKVVRYAHCPVLVARPTARRGLVICATDLSEPSLLALEAAAAEARRRSAKLVALHVIDQGLPFTSVDPWGGITPLVFSPELLGDLRMSARAAIEASLAKLEARAESVIVDGRAEPAIIEYVEAHEPELVVVGTSGRSGLPRVVLGSVAEHVARAAKTSVLVVRALTKTGP